MKAFPNTLGLSGNKKVVAVTGTGRKGGEGTM